jgi:hypothetical protein
VYTIFWFQMMKLCHFASVWAVLGPLWPTALFGSITAKAASRGWRFIPDRIRPSCRDV